MVIFYIHKGTHWTQDIHTSNVKNTRPILCTVFSNRGHACLLERFVRLLESTPVYWREYGIHLLEQKREQSSSTNKSIHVWILVSLVESIYVDYSRLLSHFFLSSYFLRLLTSQTSIRQDRSILRWHWIYKKTFYGCFVPTLRQFDCVDFRIKPRFMLVIGPRDFTIETSILIASFN